MEKIRKLFAKEQIDSDTGFCCRLVDGRKEFFDYHYHDYYEIFLTLDDDIIHNVNDTKINLSKNTLVFIRPQDRHYYESDNTNFYFYNISFSKDIYQQLKDYLNTPFFDELENLEYPPMFNLSNEDIEWVKKGFRRLNQINIEDKKTELLEFKYFILRVFFQFIISEGFHDIPCAVHPEVPIWLKKFMQSLRSQGKFSLPFDEIVGLSGKNGDYLNRTCKKCYNITLNQYINNLRLNYVANMLISTNLKIIDIFLEAGYEDVSWATVIFKKKYGLTPNAFRKNNK